MSLTIVVVKVECHNTINVNSFEVQLAIVPQQHQMTISFFEGVPKNTFSECSGNLGSHRDSWPTSHISSIEKPEDAALVRPYSICARWGDQIWVGESNLIHARHALTHYIYLLVSIISFLVL